jgi:hypothetical protein
MQVVAFSTPRNPRWRWRIVNYAGEVIEESRETFVTIASAVAQGTKRLSQMNVVDNSQPVRTFRSTAHLRGR